MKTRPSDIETMDQNLRLRGLCIVPIKPTEEMKAAAGNCMRIRQKNMGADWFMVGVKTKAGLRWEAMLRAWWDAAPIVEPQPVEDAPAWPTPEQFWSV